MRASEDLLLADLLKREQSTAQKGVDASAQLLALLNASPDVFAIIDQFGKIELINDAVHKMFLYKPEELLGKNIKCLMPDSMRHAHDKYISNYIESGDTKIIGKGRKLRAVKANGNEFPIFLRVGEVKQSSHTQFVGIITDISEQEEIQIALNKTNDTLANSAKLSSMGEIAAGIAHEISQPLAAISSYAEASKHLVSDPNINHAQTLVATLDKISDQVFRANQVIHRFRNLVKHNAAQRKKVELINLINETINLLRVDARMLSYNIEVAVADNKPIEVFVDPIQIQQVLLNLLRNAMDAMEETSTRLIKVKCRWLTKQEIELSIIDTGKGVSADISKSIFAPFSSTKENGMGMGLSVCQTIIHGHGGTIYYRANKPRGSIFSFTLPV